MTTTTNHVTGLSGFREAWDRARARVRTAPDNKVSEEGRVNIDGDAECLAAAIYTPADAEFLASVEPGVRPLVLALIDALDCITYTSCEGHPPTEDGYSPRRVGLLPRDEADHAPLTAALEPVAQATMRALGRATVDLQIVTRVLTTDDGPDLPCILVLFAATTPSWDAYVESLDPIQADFIARLRSPRS